MCALPDHNKKLQTENPLNIISSFSKYKHATKVTRIRIESCFQPLIKKSQFSSHDINKQEPIAQLEGAQYHNHRVKRLSLVPYHEHCDVCAL